MATANSYLKIFIALYVRVNPLEGLPVYLAGTKTLDPHLRLSIGRTAAISVTCIMLVALAVGRGVLAFFNISIADFMIGGGIIIFLIALKMVLGPSAAAGSSRPMNDVELRGFGIVPLGTPLLAGPGVISAVIVYASKGPTGQGNTAIDYLLLSAIIVAVGLATAVALRAAGPLNRILGETGIEVSTRISGILVAAIAIGMITQGIQQSFPMLTRSFGYYKGRDTALGAQHRRLARFKGSEKCQETRGKLIVAALSRWNCLLGFATCHFGRIIWETETEFRSTVHAFNDFFGELYSKRQKEKKEDVRIEFREMRQLHNTNVPSAVLASRLRVAAIVRRAADTVQPAERDDVVRDQFQPDAYRAITGRDQGHTEQRDSVS
jgi:multiple antibiotic resistance protein